MRFVIQNANAKEVIHAPTEQAAIDKFIRLHPEEIRNAFFIIKDALPPEEN